MNHDSSHSADRVTLLSQIAHLDAMSDAADERHASVTAELQFELYSIDRAHLRNTLDGLPPDQALIRAKQRVVAQLDDENQRLEEMVEKYNRQRAIAENNLRSFEDPSTAAEHDCSLSSHPAAVYLGCTTQAN